MVVKVQVEVLMGCDAVKCCSRILTFWRTLLPPSSATRSSETLVSICNIAWFHHPEDLDLIF
jgi:hypothetical protein